MFLVPTYPKSRAPLPLHKMIMDNDTQILVRNLFQVLNFLVMFQSMGMRGLWAGGGGQFSAPPPLLPHGGLGGGQRKNNISAFVFNISTFLGCSFFKGTAS